MKIIICNEKKIRMKSNDEENNDSNEILMKIIIVMKYNDNENNDILN